MSCSFVCFVRRPLTFTAGRWNNMHLRPWVACKMCAIKVGTIWCTIVCVKREWMRVPYIESCMHEADTEGVMENSENTENRLNFHAFHLSPWLRHIVPGLAFTVFIMCCILQVSTYHPLTWLRVGSLHMVRTENTLNFQTFPFLSLSCTKPECPRRLSTITIQYHAWYLCLCCPYIDGQTWSLSSFSM